MIARNKELPIQSLGSSVFQSWLQMTAPNNICQPGKSHEETFLSMSLGQAEAWYCRAAILDLVFSLEQCIFPKVVFFFPLNPWAASYALLTNPISTVSPSLHSSILCRFFQLLPPDQQVSQKSELGLHKHWWILDHRQLNHGDNRLFWKSIGILLGRAITFIVRSRCCEGAESSNTHLVK